MALYVFPVLLLLVQLVSCSDLQLADLTKDVQRLKQADILHVEMMANETSKNHDLQSKLMQQQSKLESQELVLNATRAKLNAQDVKIVAQQAELDSLRGEVKELRHVETGSLHCGDSANHGVTDDAWTDMGTGSDSTHNAYYYFRRERRMTATFQTAFTSPPVVFMAETFILLDAHNYNYHGIQLLNVTTTNFTMRCGVDQGFQGDEAWRLQDFEIQWIAVPV